jgi:DNA polymerase III delta prime subunit
MDAILGQEPTVSFLRSRLTDPPHIILWGPTGTGKTMLANAWITEQLTAQSVPLHHQPTMTLRLSSADDRGITAIRQRLTEFVRRVRPVAGAFAWVLIDDADNLPVVTQQALRRILELHAHQTRFCFIAQSPEHFIEPIQSRCVLLQCLPVPLLGHAAELIARHAPGITVSEEGKTLMATMCLGNVRQFTLICAALRASEAAGATVSDTDIQLLVNVPPVALLLRLQAAIIARDVASITECVLILWSKGYSFEDCIAMLEMVVRVYNGILTSELQYVLQCCAEGHIFQILNRMTTLDLIAVLSGVASSECLSEAVSVPVA